MLRSGQRVVLFAATPRGIFCGRSTREEGREGGVGSWNEAVTGWVQGGVTLFEHH